MKKKVALLLFTITISLNVATYGQEYEGKIVGISDGDTFTLLTSDKQQIKIRLAEIDTPEKAQPFGTRARQGLSDLIFGKEVRVLKQDTDRYGRLVAHAFVDGTHVNRELVRQGLAWAYRDYLKDRSLLLDEMEAREAKRGLWSLPATEQVPPWEWRKGTNKQAKVDIHQKQPQEFNCGTKRYCKEMTSCEEAKFYLNECGLTRLDGDGDGTPCETLCQ